MNSLLKFDFTVDKEKKAVHVQREFAAPRDLVWAAWTTPEILDQWWAPKPWSSKTKFMNFEVGGKRFYAMVSPDGKEMWAIQKYTSITPISNFKMWNAFADENENPEKNGSEWDYQFSEKNGITKVTVTIYNESFERMERLLEGFKLGFTASLKNLENLLASLLH